MTIKIGTVREARLGEIPTHYAIETVHKGMGLVAKAEETGAQLDIVIRWEQKHYADQWMIAETQQKRLVRQDNDIRQAVRIAAVFTVVAVAVIIGGVIWANLARAEVTPQDDHFRQATEMVVASVSSYTSSVDETDSNPFENAAGTRPARGSVACPKRFAFGTQVRIAGETYTCDDRMGGRFREGNYFDVWTETKAEAFEFGRQTLPVEIIL